MNIFSGRIFRIVLLAQKCLGIYDNRLPGVI
jgi:hypothetical protein